MRDVLGLEREEAAPGLALDGTEAPLIKGEAPKKFNPADLPHIGKGRKKGQVNRLTRSMKEAIEEAFTNVGGAAYLEKMAHGTASDRQAFMVLIGRLLPMQVNSNIDQRIRIELPWLQARGIGKVDSAEAGQLALVGKGRTIDAEAPEGAGAGGGIDA